MSKTVLPKPKSRVTRVGHAYKADTSALIVNGADAFPEDEFIGSYYTGGAVAAVCILEPIFKPGTLKALVSQNNTLAQCVAAMEVNVDGTGHSIDKDEGETDNEAEKSMLDDFFKEPYPGQSMITIRRQARVDLESCGNGYLEVIRNIREEVVLMGYLDANYMRLLRYDEPVFTDKTITRGGKEVTVKIRTRERRFVQLINGRKTFFKEFGASRDVDRDTGEWAKGTTRLPIEKRGSEILHLTAIREARTPYGAPRWLNQLPSVLGSRKAEEFNLEFFDAGGLPPAMIIVQGGYLGDQVKEELVQHMANKGNKNRAIVIEAISSSGNMDSAGAVQVKVERFGSDRMSDAMFQAYDKNSEEHVRTAFRLPPMFIGKAVDFNFATAYTAYMVAEAQVFLPERDEFDSIINNTVVKALGAKTYKFRSLPLTLVDVANQLKAVELCSGSDISGEEKVSVLNEITGLSLTYEKQETPPPQGNIDPKTNLPYDKPTSPPKTPEEIAADEGKAAAARQAQLEDDATARAHELELVQAKRDALIKKADVTTELITLADKWASMLGLTGPVTHLSPEEQATVKKVVSELTAPDLKNFNELVASKSLVMMSLDAEGLGALCGCASHLQG